MMRKGVKADTRLGFAELFFDGSFEKPLAENHPWRDAMEMTHLYTRISRIPIPVMI